MQWAVFVLVWLVNFAEPSLEVRLVLTQRPLSSFFLLTCFPLKGPRERRAYIYSTSCLSFLSLVTSPTWEFLVEDFKYNKLPLSPVPHPHPLTLQVLSWSVLGGYLQCWRSWGLWAGWGQLLLQCLAWNLATPGSQLEAGGTISGSRKNWPPVWWEVITSSGFVENLGNPPCSDLELPFPSQSFPPKEAGKQMQCSCQEVGDKLGCALYKGLLACLWISGNEFSSDYLFIMMAFIGHQLNWLWKRNPTHQKKVYFWKTSDLWEIQSCWWIHFQNFTFSSKTFSLSLPYVFEASFCLKVFKIYYWFKM